MLGYISSTRKKSCSACAKAKRRCDLGYPTCRRCLTRGLECQYPNATVLDAEVIIRQSTPDFAPLSTVAGSSPTPVPFQYEAGANLVVVQQQQQSSLSPSAFNLPVPDAVDEELERVLRDVRRQPVTEPRLCEDMLPQLWAPIYLSPDQVVFCVKRLCAVVPSVAYAGHSLFLHSSLYRGDNQPTAYQDTCSLSALYLMRTSQTTPILLNSIGSKISSLEASSSTWSLTEHLAAVQALIIYQTIRLFDPSLNAQAHAAKQNLLLEQWTARLWKRSFIESNKFTSAYDAWIFYESLRRTVLISLFLRCAWSCATNGGLSDQILQLIRLPLTRDGGLWECSPADWDRRADLSASEDQFLISYDELADSYSFAQPLEEVTGVERLLLGACVGDVDPRLLSCDDGSASDGDVVTMPSFAAG